MFAVAAAAALFAVVVGATAFVSAGAADSEAEARAAAYDALDMKDGECMSGAELHRLPRDPEELDRALPQGTGVALGHYIGSPEGLAEWKGGSIVSVGSRTVWVIGSNEAGPRSVAGYAQERLPSGRTAWSLIESWQVKPCT